MKYILTQTDKNVIGPFNQVTKTNDGYIADDVLYSTIMFGELTESEVSDTYENPNVIADFNNKQSQLREAAYKVQSDPINFQYQAGVKTKQEWLDARSAVQAQYPYKEQA